MPKSQDVIMTDLDRIEALYRAAGQTRANGAKRWFAERIRIGTSAISKWDKTGEIPPYAAAIIELLEACPVANWPDRWRN